MFGIVEWTFEIADWSHLFRTLRTKSEFYCNWRSFVEDFGMFSSVFVIVAVIVVSSLLSVSHSSSCISCNSGIVLW